ncbi:MAG: response regulator [Bacteroidota bacterium]
MPENKKILIAEDSSVIQNLARKILEFQNYSITGVRNGSEVLEALATEDYSLLLLDINMPVMDGMETARKVRSLGDSKKAGIPIVAITGNAKNYSMEEFKAAGINDYLQKPLNFDRLVELAKELTQKQPA